MIAIRRQLTLFINEPKGSIEKIRAKYNSVQYGLVPAHITLCRENEIEPIENTIEQLKSISLEKPLQIELKQVKRFADGKGVFIAPLNDYQEFIQLRKLILKKDSLIKEQIPHITLMHPRNSTCTDQIFEQILSYHLTTKFEFKRVSLIEQVNSGKWKILQEFEIVKNNAK